MKKLIIFLMLLISTNLFAVPPFGGEEPDPEVQNTAGIPINGGIYAFLIAGLGIGIRLFYKSSKTTKE